MIDLSAIRKRDWERHFEIWAQPPGQTEQQKCERAVGAIKQAVSDSPLLSRGNIETFAQGSFANRLNVPRESDVDVCIKCNDVFLYELQSGLILPDIGFSPATYGYAQYKNEVEGALVTKFGRDKVVRGDKAFDINETTYRVDADAVACFEFRLYYRNAFGIGYHSGAALITDREQKRLTNFPKQQYDRGVAKNDNTGRRYKPLVRIVKSLRNEMDDAGIAAAEPIASFLIESCVWNVPNARFGFPTLRESVNAVLVEIHSATSNDDRCRHYLESNGIKQLFTTDQEWTREQVHNFAFAALAYINRL